MLLEVRSSSNDLHQQAGGRLPGLSFKPWLQPGVNANAENPKTVSTVWVGRIAEARKETVKTLRKGVNTAPTPG
jgi:hypothetical protein